MTGRIDNLSASQGRLGGNGRPLTAIHVYVIQVSYQTPRWNSWAFNRGGAANQRGPRPVEGGGRSSRFRWDAAAPAMGDRAADEGRMAAVHESRSSHLGASRRHRRTRGCDPLAWLGSRARRVRSEYAAPPSYALSSQRCGPEIPGRTHLRQLPPTSTNARSDVHHQHGDQRVALLRRTELSVPPA